MIGILTDITKCIGCEKCVQACQKENNCNPELPEHKAKPEELFSTRWTSIITQPQQHFIRRQCRHCVDPACVNVCPVGAMIKSHSGAVLYNKKKCIGCRYCMMACPYGIPRSEWESRAPGIKKCTLCHHRITKNQQPACTEICPENATIFGERADLIKKAKSRISQNTKKYKNHIYGEFEVGGTHILYISDIPLNFLGFKQAIGTDSMPSLSWKGIKLTPIIAGTVVTAMVSIRWIIKRRMQLQVKRDKQ
jgi:formate dehydrogenase iron-sulfur subunit